jgi:hypothetical protein
MTTEVNTTGIATIKPKRKYTKRKGTKIKAVKTTGRATRTRSIKGDPKTARAYMHRMGLHFDKESLAVTELIRMHKEKTVAHAPADAPLEAFLPSWRYQLIHWLAGDANDVRVYKR